MKKILPIFLGILTAIGGFVDMGDLVANAAIGARFGMTLAWVVIVGHRRHHPVRQHEPAGSPRSPAGRCSTSSESGSGRGSRRST